MQKGFIQLLIILALLIIVISLLGISLSDVAQNPRVKGNFSFVYNAATWLWDNYLRDPASIVFRVWMDVLWKPFVSAMQKVGSGQVPIIGQ